MNRKKNASTVLVYGVLIFITLICLFPIVWMCLISIKSTSESITGFNSLMVSNPTMANFKRLFEMIPVGQNAFNSVFTTIMGTITSLFFCALAGFAFAKYKMCIRDRSKVVGIRIYTDEGIYGDGEVAGIHATYGAFGVIKDMWPFISGKDPFDNEAVSYTHLDVYKRQHYHTDIH